MDGAIQLRNTLRLIAAATAVILATGAGQAFAQINVTEENVLTGSNSLTENVVVTDDTVTVTVTNDATATNGLDLDVESGDNDIEDNTVVEGFMGGDIEGDIVFETMLNTVDSTDGDLAIDPLSVEADFLNSRTGSNSEASNELTVTRNIDVDMTNSATITNDFDLDLDTGDNDIEDNTIVGDIETGGVDITLDVTSRANQTSGFDLSGVTNNEVSVESTNETTGSNSEATNTTVIASTVDVDVTNTATIDNTFDVDADSGDNDIEDNTEVGNITTGDVRINIRSVNEANTSSD